MCDILQQRLRDFGVYLSALADLRHDRQFLKSGHYVCNVDFSCFYPFFWGSYKRPANFTDRVRLNMFSRYVDRVDDSGMVFAFSRSTIFEMMASIWSEVRHLQHISRNPSLAEQHTRRIGRFFDSDEDHSSEEYAKQLSFYYGLIPADRADKTNIDLTIDLLKRKKIVSFYDVFGYEEVRRLRSEINSLADEISPSFIQKPDEQLRDPDMKAIRKDVDVRNIATSAVLSQRFDGYLAPFLCAPYTVKHDTYAEVKRSHFVAGFWFEALNEVGKFEDASIIADSMLRDAKTCSDWLRRYRDERYEDLPDFAASDIGTFLLNYIDPLESPHMKNEIDVKVMKDRIAGKASSTKEFRDAVDERGAEYIAKAREMIRSFEGDDDLIAETGIEDNPRAREVLGMFFPKKDI